MTYSAEFKFIDSLLNFFIKILPEVEITKKRIELWKRVESLFADSKLENEEFLTKISKCRKTLAEKWKEIEID